MSNKKPNRLKEILKSATFTDVIVTVAVLLALGLVFIDVFQRYRKLDLVEIVSPVLIDKKQYRAGDTIFGVFQGEVKTDLQPLVTRAIVCEDHHYELTDRQAVGGRRFLRETQVAITTLSASDLKQQGQEIEPSRNCYISFTNIYEIPLPISGTRFEHVRYFSDTFDIVAGETETTIAPNETVELLEPYAGDEAGDKEELPVETDSDLPIVCDIPIVSGLLECS